MEWRESRELWDTATKYDVNYNNTCQTVEITNFFASFPLVNLIGCLANSAAAFLRKYIMLI